MLLGPQTWSLNFFFFCKFDFSYFLNFSCQYQLERGKSLISKGFLIKTRLTFHSLFLKSIIFLIRVDVDKKNPIKFEKSNLQKKKEVE